MATAATAPVTPPVDKSELTPAVTQMLLQSAPATIAAMQTAQQAALAKGDKATADGLGKSIGNLQAQLAAAKTMPPPAATTSSAHDHPGRQHVANGACRERNNHTGCQPGNDRSDHERGDGRNRRGPGARGAAGGQIGTNTGGGPDASDVGAGRHSSDAVGATGRVGEGRHGHG